MFGTDISMDLVIQYGLQAASGLLILGIGAFLAKSAGGHTTRPWVKWKWSPRFDSYVGVFYTDRIQNPFPQREIRMLNAS